jgi:hypothetical protein
MKSFTKCCVKNNFDNIGSCSKKWTLKAPNGIVEEG